jgi:hypothetical protein
VTANDVNVAVVQLLPATGPANGTLTLNLNGAFTYVPGPSWSAIISPATSLTTTDSFQYYANNNPGIIATVSLNLSKSFGMLPLGVCPTEHFQEGFQGAFGVQRDQKQRIDVSS